MDQPVHQITEATDAREALYQRLIMERARAPLYQGVLEPSDGSADGNNPFCGDRVHVTLRRSADGLVTRVAHRTRGCAICMASADVMAESVAGQDPVAIHSLYAGFDVMLHKGPLDSGSVDLGLLNAFENLHEYRSRIRCATLPWTALLEALDGKLRSAL